MPPMSRVQLAVGSVAVAAVGAVVVLIVAHDHGAGVWFALLGGLLAIVAALLVRD